MLRKASITMKLVLLGCIGVLCIGLTQAASLDCTTATNINVPVVECQALLDLYDSTNGLGWFQNLNRDTDTDVCSRYGIDCMNIGGQNRVTHVQLGNNNLVGTLPASLSGLVELRFFAVESNQLSGTLAPEWKSWIHITGFYVAFNQLSGPLPPERSGWTQIESFYAYDNQLFGLLPSERSTRNQLKVINISNNQFSGPLPPARSGRVSIESFWVVNNQISGPLPPERSTRTNIQYINLSVNPLHTHLPPQWSTWVNMQAFVAVLSNLTGTLPPERSGWTNIIRFRVPQNTITGNLPDSWSSWTNITSFRVEDNHIHGGLPDSWQSRLNLTNFQAQKNKLTGPIPDSRANNRPNHGMVYVNLTENCLTTHGYNPSTQAWIDANVALFPQNTCPTTSSNNASPGIGGGSSVLLTPDYCPEGDFSLSYYDKMCGEVDNKIPMQMQKKRSQNKLTKNIEFTCPYDDGDFDQYNFIDVSEYYRSSVQTLLRYCLIHGYNNEGKIFGTYQPLKRGELYKIFARLANIPFASSNPPGVHWSYRYFVAGENILRPSSRRRFDPEDYPSLQHFQQVVYAYLQRLGIHTIKIPNKSNNKTTIQRREVARIVDVLIAYTNKFLYKTNIPPITIANETQTETYYGDTNISETINYRHMIDTAGKSTPNTYNQNHIFDNNVAGQTR